MARLRLCLLGPYQVTLDGVPVTAFPSAKVRALLAYLAVESERPHPRESLAGLLWPDYPESSARTNLRNALAHLRGAIGDREATPPFLHISREMAQFNTAADAWVDVTVFRETLEGSETLKGLEAATALYRGPFLEGFSVGDSAPFEEWVLMTRERLQRQAVEALGRLAALHEAQGEPRAAIAAVRRQLQIEPWYEGAHRDLMRLLALQGQRSAALAQYEAAARALRQELDVEPSAETTALYQQIQSADLPGVPKPDTSVPRHNLPAQLTPFVGREDLLAALEERLADPGCRLLTLVGPGGSGKTRLALEAAARQVDRYPHGVFFVSLAPLHALDSIVPTIAQALGLTLHGGEPQAQLLEYLRPRRALLLLDNFEHLIEGAGLTTEILRAAPEVVLLVTSRVGLRVHGESRFPVPGLPCPDPSAGTLEPAAVARCDSVALFVERARRADPDFELSGHNVADVIRICHLVDGMPLGILLAAAWVGMLAPAEIAAEMERGLDLLQSEQRDVPERQRSLRAAFDYSWRLLGEREQEVFCALSVFCGGFTRHAAKEVAGASLRELLALADKSLLHRAAAERYELHEVLRQYAAEKLASSPDAEQQARDRHAAHYAGALEGWAAELKGPRQQAALAEIEADVENARAAWEWAVEQREAGWLAQSVDGLGRFYEWRGRYLEGNALFAAAAGALAADDVAPPAIPVARQQALVRILAWQSIYHLFLGSPERVRDLSQRSLALLEALAGAGHDVRRERAFVLWAVGRPGAFWGIERRKSRLLLEESRALYQALGDRWETASVLYLLGTILQALGRYEQAVHMERESLALHRQLGDPLGSADSLEALARVLMEQGDLAEAERLMRECLALRVTMDDPLAIASARNTLGFVLEWQGRFAGAYALYEAALAAVDDVAGLAERGGLATARLGWIELHLGQYDEARLQMQAGLERFRDVEHGWQIGMTLLYMGQAAMAEGDHAAAEARLRESLVELQRAETRSGMVWARAALAGTALLRERTDEARAHLGEALRIVDENRSFIALLVALPFLAWLLAARGQLERAIELWALAARHPHVARSQWYRDLVGRRIREAAAALPPDAVAAAEGRGSARDLWATAEALRAELDETSG